jgi:hypothetical protein
MAGLGRKVFTPGEVLTATNVQNYLMDQAVQVYAGTAARGSAIGSATTEGMVSYLSDTNSVQMATGTATWVNVDSLPIVSGTATRNALYPSPILGNTVFRSDLGYSETYYTAYGTANPGGRASAGWYNNERNMGLVPIVPPTVNVSGGTATANTLGTITFTTATSISLNSVFTSTFANYRIILNLDSTSVGTDVAMRVRSAGTDLTSGTYQYSKGLMNSAAYAVDFQTSSTNINFGRSSGTGGVLATLDIASPQLAQYTKLNGLYAQGSSPIWFGSTYANVGNTTSYDGFTMYPQTGASNMTGTVQIFGYNS